MNRNRTRGAAAILGLAIAAAIAVAALAGGGPTADPGTTPLPTPTTPPASQPPTAEPTDPTVPGPIRIDLDTVDGHDVTIEIRDGLDLIERAVSGRPRDGASVPPYRLEVRNLDPRTLELAWTDFPIDNELTLLIVETGGRLTLAVVQPEPTEPTDAIGFDRRLVLTFREPVSADDVLPILQDGLDTSAS